MEDQQENNKKEKMDWLKMHADTVVIIGAIIGSIFWMNGKFSDIKTEMSAIEKEIAIVKTVLVMKNVMPVELAVAEKPAKN